MGSLPVEGGCLRTLELRILDPALAPALCQSVVASVQRRSSGWLSRQAEAELRERAPGAIWEALSDMKIRVATGRLHFEDLMPCRAYLIIRATTLLQDEATPKEIPVQPWIEVAQAQEEPTAVAQVVWAGCSEALVHALTSFRGGASLERVANELSQGFGLTVIPADLAIHLAMAIRHLAGRDPRYFHQLLRLARPRLAPGLLLFFSDRGLSGRDLRIVVDMALGISDSATASALQVTHDDPDPAFTTPGQ